jgi:hypothetical protein
LLRKGLLVFVSFSIITNIIAISLTNSTSAQQLANYTDPNGDFTILYPVGWEVEPKQNRFEDFEVSFTNMQAEDFALFDLDIRENVTEKTFSIEELKEAFTEELNKARYGLINFELEEPIDCKKYKIEGHHACSAIYTSETGVVEPIMTATMPVVTSIGNDVLSFFYSSYLDNFDIHLPNIEKMLSSFSTNNR